MRFMATCERMVVMFFSIDRIVGDIAVLIGEDGRALEVPVAMLPVGAKAGEMLYHGNEGFSLAPDKTAERRSRVAGMLELLLHHGDEEE